MHILQIRELSHEGLIRQLGSEITIPFPLTLGDALGVVCLEITIPLPLFPGEVLIVVHLSDTKPLLVLLDEVFLNNAVPMCMCTFSCV